MADVRQQYALPPRYVLYPANTWHHKNHARLIEALARYRDEHGEAPTLVLTGVGKEGAGGPRGRGRPSTASRGSVRMLGYVPRDDLPALYAGAACLVFPSLFEGFGIPLVEAMLARMSRSRRSDATSIPEVVGDAGVLFDPLRPGGHLPRPRRHPARSRAVAAELARRGRAARRALLRGEDGRRCTLELFESVVARRPSCAGVAAGRELIAVEGVYDDQWMGREAVLALARPGAACRSRSRATLAGPRSLVPQDLVVEVDGSRRSTCRSTAPGPFSLDACRSPPTERPPPACGRCRSSRSRTFCPRDHGLSADGRDLSVQLLRVRARTRDGRQIVEDARRPSGPESVA